MDELSRKLYASFHALERMQNVLSFKTKGVLAQTLLLPLLDYSDVCYLDFTEALLNKLEYLQNLCIRFIIRLRKYDHVSLFRSKPKQLMLKLSHRRQTHLLTLLYKIPNDPLAPTYLLERFKYLWEYERALCSQTKKIGNSLSQIWILQPFTYNLDNQSLQPTTT